MYEFTALDTKLNSGIIAKSIFKVHSSFLKNYNIETHWLSGGQRHFKISSFVFYRGKTSCSGNIWV